MAGDPHEMPPRGLKKPGFPSPQTERREAIVE